MEVTTRQDSPIRVAVVDDHALMREGIIRVLDSTNDMVVVGEADCGAGALNLVRSVEADVLLLDYRLPDIDGCTVLRELRSDGCMIPVLMLTCFGSERCVRSAMRAGANGFLTKQSANRALLADAVRKAYRNLSAVSPDALEMLVSGMRNTQLRSSYALTPRETEVWTLLASGKTNSEIADVLFVSVQTVKFHVGNILRKTGSRSRAEATALAYRCDLMDPES